MWEEGNGFSGKPKRSIGPRKMASLFVKLMTRVPGYDSYVAQGGNWGGATSSWLRYEHAPALANKETKHGIAAI